MTNKYNEGDIWLIKYVFEDNPTKFANRPVVLINDNENSYICVKMTKQSPRDKYEYSIKDWASAGLNMQTTIRTSKMLPISDKIIIKKLGTLQPYDLSEFRNKLEEYANYIKSTKAGS